MSLFDSHCHFDDSVFDHRREALWSECQRLGVTRLLIPGLSPSQWDDAYPLTEKFAGIYMSAGLHPWFLHCVDNEPDWSEKLASFLSLPKCLAVGECGLDGGIDIELSVQQVFFEQQIQLAIAYAKPLILHVHRSHNEVYRLLKNYKPNAGGVIHGFTGSYQQAKDYWDLGFFIGVGGSITYPRAKKTRHAISSMPLESLVLETDAPFMPIYGAQGTHNSPLYMFNIKDCLIDLRAESAEVIESRLQKNTEILFGC